MGQAAAVRQGLGQRMRPPLPSAGEVVPALMRVRTAALVAQCTQYAGWVGMRLWARREITCRQGKGTWCQRFVSAMHTRRSHPFRAPAGPKKYGKQVEQLREICKQATIKWV